MVHALFGSRSKCHASTDRELYAGPGTLNKFQGLYLSNDPDNPKWNEVSVMIFDAVEEAYKPLLFSQRMQLVQGFSAANVKVVDVHTCMSPVQLKAAFDAIVSKDGEGIMLRVDAPYKAGRTNDLIKYKRFATLDAKVVGYTPGSGRFQNQTGALKLERLDDPTVKFKCTPEDRRRPPPIGSIVEIKYMVLTEKGNPRHPRFLRVRMDL